MRTYADTIQPLPLRVEPQPWEELVAFLARTARHMHYQNITWLLQPETLSSRIPSRNLSLLTSSKDYHHLCTLLALSVEQVYQMTLHRLHTLSHHLSCFPPFHHLSNHTPLLTSKTAHGTTIYRPLLTQQVQQFCCFPSRTTQICPLCLEEPIAYDRLYWRVRYFITCPKHMVLLQRFCGRCQSPIPSARIDPRGCPACKHPYISSLTPIPSEHAFLLTGDLLAFHALAIPHQSFSPSLPSLENDPRALLPSEQYLALLRALSLCLRPLHISDIQSLLPPPLLTLLFPKQITSLTPQERLPLLHLATIHWLFAQWPNRFSTLTSTLTSYARREGRKMPALFPNSFFTRAPQASHLLLSPHSRYP